MGSSRIDLAKNLVSSKRRTTYHGTCPETKLDLPVEPIQAKSALLDGRAGLDPKLRRGVEGYCARLRGGQRIFAQVPKSLETLLRKIATDAYKVIDEDIQTLRELDYSDGVNIELVICASLGAAMGPVETAYAALQEK